MIRIIKRYRLDFSRITLAMLIVYAALDALAAQGIRGKIREGNEHFKNERFEEALGKYQDALLDDQQNDQAKFNKGDALYKLQKYDEALQGFQQVIGSKDLDISARAFYNIGNVQFQQNKLQECIDAYKKSLELNPNDVDAKYNLELARAKLKEMADKQQMPQQQQQQQQKSGEQQKDQNQQDQQQQQQQQQGQMAQAEEKKDKEQKDQSNPQDQKDKISKDEAERILKAMQESEQEAQKKKAQVPSGQRRVGKDW
jgi:tetratricopeptide (TPR) repeat protein